MNTDESTVRWKWLAVTVIALLISVLFLLSGIVHLLHGCGYIFSAHPIKSLHQCVVAFVDVVIAYGVVRLGLYAQRKIVVEH